MKRLLAALAALLPVACQGPGSTPHPHYVLGSAYQEAGIWYYPAAHYEGAMTGLATVYRGDHAPLTTDGEAFGQDRLAAASRTLQLPAIARVTNLETGRQVVVRINDRGPANPGRLIEVTRRTAELLGFPPSGVARVRVALLTAESRAAVESLPDGPRLPIAAAPLAAVAARSLPMAIGGAQPRPATAHGSRTPASLAPAPLPGTAAAPPLRLPETVTVAAPAPGQLWVQLSEFDQYVYAAQLRGRLAGLHPEIEPVFDGRQEKFRVRIGPLADVARADATLDQVIRAGVTDARIVVE